MQKADTEIDTITLLFYWQGNIKTKHGEAGLIFAQIGDENHKFDLPSFSKLTYQIPLFFTECKEQATNTKGLVSLAAIPTPQKYLKLVICREELAQLKLSVRFFNTVSSRNMMLNSNGNISRESVSAYNDKVFTFPIPKEKSHCYKVIFDNRHQEVLVTMEKFEEFEYPPETPLSHLKNVLLNSWVGYCTPNVEPFLEKAWQDYVVSVRAKIIPPTFDNRFIGNILTEAEISLRIFFRNLIDTLPEERIRESAHFQLISARIELSQGEKAAVLFAQFLRIAGKDILNVLENIFKKFNPMANYDSEIQSQKTEIFLKIKKIVTEYYKEENNTLFNSFSTKLSAILKAIDETFGMAIRTTYKDFMLERDKYKLEFHNTGTDSWKDVYFSNNQIERLLSDNFVMLIGNFTQQTCDLLFKVLNPNESGPELFVTSMLHHLDSLVENTNNAHVVIKSIVANILPGIPDLVIVALTIKTMSRLKDPSFFSTKVIAPSNEESKASVQFGCSP